MKGKEKEIFAQIASNIIDNEIKVAVTNQQDDNADFEALIDLIECKRGEKDYDWMSDIFLPEFPSILLTDASDWANQYFQTRSFVEVKLEGDNVEDKQKCQAAKLLINKTLNNREIFHYHKYIRSRLLNSLMGNVYILCWWEKKLQEEIIGQRSWDETGDTDIYGNQLMDENLQIPQIETKTEDVKRTNIIYDRFNYDVIDPRNVFTDSKYAYTVQKKDWVAIRSEKSLEDLIALKEENGYINLDILEKIERLENTTDTAKETYNKNRRTQSFEKAQVKYFDVYERFGKYFCLIEEEDENGYPIKIKPGYDERGNILKDARLIETIITVAVNGSSKTLIRFQPTPFIDNKGNTYKPIVRGWCYIHPTKDIGLSDGKYSRELQVAINDTYNMSSDRTKLSTLPTLKGKKYSLMDNDTIYFEPEHVMELEDTSDIEEFKIESDVSGAINQIGLLKNYMQQVTAKYPTVMGELPEHSATTATAVNETSQRGSSRNNYKSLTVEYTYLVEFYWLILQMSAQFMEEETAKKVLGDKISMFDPDCDYTYSPVTSSIELEQNKFRKLQIIDQFLGRVANLPNPNTPKLINYLLTKAFELFGDEFPEYKQFLLNPDVPTNVDNGQGAMQGAEQGGLVPPNNVPNVNTMPTSNQEGTPMSGLEMNTRGI